MPLRDLKLTEDLDVAIEDGDLVIIEDLDAVAQMIRIRLRRVLGEWYLDITSGTDYFDGIFAKGAAYEATVREQILGTPYVRGLTLFAAAFDVGARRLTVEFTAATEFGSVTEKLELP